MARARFERYVAIGDSISEGIGDESLDGTLRGWCDRLAEHLDAAEPGLRYANLAVRGQTAHQVYDTQLAPALALRPDLVTVSAGMNDMMRRGFSVESTQAALDDIVRQLTEAEATVVVLSLPDMTGLLPIGARIKPVVDSLNSAIVQIVEKYGALAPPPPPRPLFADSRLWAADRLHLSGLGYERVANAVLNELGYPSAAWDAPLEEKTPDPGTVSRVAQSAVWWVRAAGPWLARRLTGRSTGDGRVGKRLELIPISNESTH